MQDISNITGREIIIPKYECLHVVAGSIMSQNIFDSKQEANKFFDMQTEGLSSTGKDRLILRCKGKKIRDTWR